MSRLAALWQRGIRVYSHFSGLDMPALQLETLGKLLEMNNYDGCSARNIFHEHACDIDPNVRRYLMAQAKECRPRHIHQDIMGRLPAGLRRKLELAKAAGNRELENKVNELNGQGAKGSQVKLAMDQVARSTVRKLLTILAEEDSGISSWSSMCDVHGSKCFVMPGGAKAGRVTMAVGSSSCTDYSKYGSKRFTFGANLLPMIVFFYERRAMKEDFFLHENVVEWYKHAYWILEECLGDLYLLETVQLSPDWFGFPCTRDRTFT